VSLSTLDGSEGDAAGKAVRMADDQDLPTDCPISFVLANQSLVISPVDVADAGFYQCEASNGVGNNINALMALQVHGI
jgi:hypothetical protein